MELNELDWNRTENEAGDLAGYAADIRRTRSVRPIDVGGR
jgi:hypothetical protein